MTTTLQFIDPTTSAVIFDLNDPTGANAADNGYSMTRLRKDPDFGGPGWEFTRFAPSQGDGGTTTFSRAGLRTMTVPIIFGATSYDNYTKAVGRLAQICAAGGRLKFIADGSANTRYIDVEPSPTPFFIDGREQAMYEALRLYGTAETGVVLSLSTQPFWFGDLADSAPNKVLNATLLRDGDASGIPDGWTASGGMGPSISTTNLWFTANFASTNSTESTITTAAAAVGQTWTASIYGSRVSGAGTWAVRLHWYTAGSVFISEDVGTAQSSAALTRATVTAVAPATTGFVRIQVKVAGGAGTVLGLKNAQLEQAASASVFRVGTETADIDPEPASGMARLLPFWNPSDARVPVKVTITSGATVPGGAIVGAGPLDVTLLNSAGLFQIEDFTNGTDTANDSTVTNSPGAGTTGKKTTFATLTLASRATLVQTTGLEPYAGRTFMVVLRIRADGADYNGVVALVSRWGNAGATARTLSKTLTTLTAASPQEFIMGTVTFPDVVASALRLDLQASRTSGTGNLLWDCITLVPVEYAAARVGTFSAVAGDALVLDSPNNLAYLQLAAGGSAGPVDVSGPAYFVAPPGLSMVYAVTGTAGTDDGVQSAITSVQTLAFSFAPRYPV